MDIDKFEEIIRTFADQPNDIIFTKGRMVFQLQGQMLDIVITQKDEMLYITENGIVLPAGKWLTTRVAQLPLLADRILSHVHEEPCFVSPAAIFQDDPEHSQNDDEVPVADAVHEVIAVLDRKLVKTSSVLYLTSDAGEGKTTLINHLAIEQARRFKQQKSNWLLVPISLGGRPFMRFDDLVVGALLNRLRFHNLAFDTFIELVRLGYLVPALDGFEELFTEKADGGAVSALGELLEKLNSSGSLLIAARKAYYEQNTLQSQAKLFDALGNMSVSFSRLKIQRWTEKQYLAYAKLRKIEGAEKMYADVRKKFPHDDIHPILTRPVFVKRLMDVAASEKTSGGFLSKINAAQEDFFSSFVEAIVSREVTKWIDKNSETARPLLTLEQHHDLLALLAQQMWEEGAGYLRSGDMDVIADMYCANKSLPLSVKRQVIEKLKQHALITTSDEAKGAYSFDHEEFFNYYLGVAVCRSMLAHSGPDLRQMLRGRPLPKLTVELAARMTRTSRGVNLRKCVEFVRDAGSVEDSASFVRENCGALLVDLLNDSDLGSLVIANQVFPPDALRSVKLKGLQFDRCYFQSTSLEGCEIVDSSFVECTFERLDLHSDLKIGGIKLTNSIVHVLRMLDNDRYVYEPGAIRAELCSVGFDIPNSQPIANSGIANEPDEDYVVVDKTLKLFFRSVEINERSFQQRLGKRYPRFTATVLPTLKRENIVQGVEYQGAGQQERYRLLIPMRILAQALESSGGRFAEFIRLVRASKRDN